MWYIEDTGQDRRQLSWATATRSLRRLKARIVNVGGKREQPQAQTWKLTDAAQWELLFQLRAQSHCLLEREEEVEAQNI
jgi:hypothetical protein